MHLRLLEAVLDEITKARTELEEKHAALIAMTERVRPFILLLYT